MDAIIFGKEFSDMSWVGLRDRNGEGKYRYVDDNSLLDVNDTTTFNSKLFLFNKKRPRTNYPPNGIRGRDPYPPGNCIGLHGYSMHNLNCSLPLYGLCEMKYTRD